MTDAWYNGANEKNKPIKITPDIVRAIEVTLAKGERVELIPVKDGVKLVRVRREGIKENG